MRTRERARGATDHGTVMHVVVDGGREEHEDLHHVVQGLDFLFAEESPRPLVHPFALVHERGEEVVEDHAQDPFLQNLGPPCPEWLLSKLAGIHALGRAGTPELNNGASPKIESISVSLLRHIHGKERTRKPAYI